MSKLFQIPMLFLLLAPAVASAQVDTFQLLREFKTNVVQLAVDNLDNVYTISSTDQLKKWNAQGDSAGVYNQVKRFGKLQSLDVTNPLKLLLFYKDFSTVVILDRQLALRNALDLRKLNIIQTSAIGLSYDNNIWLFDAYENKLKKLDGEGNLLLQTPDLRTIFADAIQPQQIIDQDGQLYLSDTANGIYEFDYYGSFKKKLPLTGWQHIAVWNDYITGIQGNRFQFYNMRTLLGGSRALPALAATANVYLSNHKLFTWQSGVVRIYNYPL